MGGFNIVLGKGRFTNKLATDNCIVDTFETPNYCVNQFTVNKFLEDKIFYENEDLILVLDGVILNKSSFISENVNWIEAIIDLYKDEGEVFFNKLRGSFTGMLFDKVKDTWLVFADHIASKRLFYSFFNSEIYISSDIDDLFSLFKKEKISYSLDEDSAYMLLSYGYMLNDNTLCKEIKKILPGNYLRIKNNRTEVIEYYRLPKSTTHGKINEIETINTLDEKFRNAVKIQFEKDKEYGYAHLVGLSGGLDSRMTSWVAHDLGFKNQINFTFSQSNYLDETIPKQIAEDLKHEWIFKSLDNGLFLKNLDETNLISGGNSLYYGLAHGNSMMKLLNFKNLGIVHSGQLGDIVIGSFIKNFNVNVNNLGGEYSKKLIDKISLNQVSINNILEKEQELIYMRGFSGANNGLLVSQEYSETVSPFYDIDFFEYCLSIPIEHRMKHKLYKKWILTKYPGASKYVWEATKSKITSKPITINYRGNNISLKQLLSIILAKMKLKKNGSSSRRHMNPIDYWYETNKEIKEFQDHYFEQNIELLKNNSALMNDTVDLYRKGNSIEKNQVLTLLSALKLFFN